MFKRKSGDTQFYQATQHFSQQKWEDTVTAIELALKKGVKQYDLAYVYAVYGYALTKLSREEDALLAHQKSVEINPNHIVAWRYYGITLRITGDYAGAEQAYLHALEIDPKDELTLSSLGALYIFRDWPQKAIDILEEACRDGVVSAVSFSNLALAYNMVSRFEDAEIFLSKAIAQGYQNWRSVRSRIQNMKEFHQSLNLKDTSWLPAHCPACGAAIAEDSVQWISDTTARCGYCGIVVH